MSRPILTAFLAVGIGAAYATPLVRVVGGQEGQSPEESMAQRVSKGLNLQWIVRLEPGETLDPNSVQVKWRDAELPTYTYYTSPQIALLFAAPPAGNAGEQGDIELQFSLLDEEEFITHNAHLTLREPAKPPAGLPYVRILDENGAPVPDGRLFGQRREDLFATANDQGEITLTAPTRNTPTPHWAWAPGYWAVDFDPRTSPTIALTPLPESFDLCESTAELRITDASDQPIDPALVWVNRTYWAPVQDGVVKICLPEAQPAEVMILSADYTSSVAKVSKDDRIHVRLNKSAAKAAAE